MNKKVKKTRNRGHNFHEARTLEHAYLDEEKTTKSGANTKFGDEARICKRGTPKR